MGRINLLPDSFKIKTSTVKTSELLKKIYIVIFVLVFISIATSFGPFYMFNFKINDAEVRKRSIITQIKALKETEQRLILVKDRLRKVEQISKKKDADKELEGFNLILKEIGLDVLINTVSVSDKSLELNIQSASTVDTFEFMEFIEDSGTFSSVTIKSMGFSNKTGFVTQLILKKK